MELTPSEERKLKKLAKFMDDNQIATVDSFIELEDKVEAVAEKLDTKLSEVVEEVKKKSLELSVIEIDKDELRGEDGLDGDDGEDYILTEQDLDDIALKVKIPTVEKIIEKTEVIRETPIVTEIVKEVAVADSADEIRNKLEVLNGDDRLTFSAIKESDSILKDITALKARPVQFESGRGGGGNIEVFQSGNKKGSGSAIDFIGATVTHDGHKATVTVSPDAQNLQAVTDNGSVTTNDIEANSFIKTGGTPSEFLKADGSVDSNAYVTGTPWTSEGYLTNISGQDLSLADNTTSQFITLGDVDLSGYVPYTGANANLDLGNNRITLSGNLVGSVYRGVNIDTSGAGSGRSIPLQVIYDDASTNLTGNISGMIFTNNNTTNNSYAGLAFSSQDLAGTTLVNSFIHGVMTSHTTGAMSGDIVFGNRSLGALSESMRLKASGELTLTRNFETGVRERLFTATVTDDTISSFFINNGTITNGLFAPVFGGYSESTTLWPLGFSAFTNSTGDASNSSDYGLMDFAAMRTTSASDSLNGTLSAIQNRKLFTFRGGPTTSDIKMTILASGNVGIGTDTPEQLTTLSGVANVSLLTEIWSANTNSGGILGLKARGTKASPTVPLANDNLFTIGGGGYNGTTMYNYNKALISMRASQNWTGAANGTYITFETTPDASTTRAERVRITQAGRVGNFSAPACSFHFRDAGFPVARFDRMITSTTTGNFGVMALQSQTTGNMADGFGAAISFQIRDNAGVDNSIATIAATRSGADNSGALVFSTFNAGTAAERMRITNAGLVAINTASPVSTSGGLDIASGGRGLVVGADLTATTRTNNVAKNGYVCGAHFTNAEEPVLMIGCESQSGVNRIIFGGGRTITNGATEYRWYMPANSTSTLGSEIMVINTSANLGVGPFSTLSDVQARVHSIWTGGEQLRLGYSTSSYIGFTVDVTGVLTINGTAPYVDFQNVLRASNGVEIFGTSRFLADDYNYIDIQPDTFGNAQFNLTGGGRAVFNCDVEATGFVASGNTGYTGPLNDSTSTQIADVVGGIITAVYY